MSIRYKLIFGVGAALLVCIAILMSVNSIQVRSLLERQLTQSDLPANVTAIANAVENEMLPAITAAQTIGDNEFLLTWLEHGEDESELPLNTHYLNKLKSHINAHTAFLVSKNTGNYYTDAGKVRTISQQSDAWFYDFLQQDIPLRFDLDADKTTNILSLFVNVRISVKGEALGVAGIGISLAAMQQQIKEFRFAQTGIVCLLDVNGNVLAHPNSELVGENISTILPHDTVSALSGAENIKFVNFKRNQETMAALNIISTQIKDIVDRGFQVAAATEEQSAVTEEISKDVQQISELSHSSAQEMQECVAEMQALGQLAQELDQAMRVFRL